jgi:hypothetical protein
MMFENLEELLKMTHCRVQSADAGRWLCWGDGAKTWFVMERKRYAKKTKTLYQGNDLREAMQFLR